MHPDWRLVVSCEHASNRVPKRYRGLFQGEEGSLASHRGYDPGAAELARIWAAKWQAELFCGEVTRLLVDLNRSAGHPQLYSEFSRQLPSDARLELRKRYHAPYRERLKQAVRAHLEEGRRVLHLSVHSFTPVLAGEIRNADIGLLYDPRRTGELAFSLRWQRELKGGGLKVRRNYPYRGRADGVVTWLRTGFPAALYLGLELELNQALCGNPTSWKMAQENLGRTFASVWEALCAAGTWT